ncbi:MAG: DUF4105 domain-containing protein, partial [Spirochaetota bacterium]|nr:DUF4105 domain-containing protein [Spirochaetota bacterium]
MKFNFKKYFKVLVILIFLFILPSNAEALDIMGDSLEVRLLIIGQGDPVYSLFGHTGIAIKNKDNGRDIFYDFGNFSFEEDNFFENFAFGHMLYMAYAAYTKSYISLVLPEKRNITEYVLNLSAENKLEMYNNLNIMVLPENRNYQYHHYKDNCSTRIRDYINDGVDGQLQIKTELNNGSTFRKSFLRFTAHKSWVGSFLSILQGPEIDRDITIWQEMYLPDTLEKVIKDFKYKNSKGKIVPLVDSINIIYKDEDRVRIPESYTPPYGRAVIISLLLSSFIVLLNYQSRKNHKIPFVALNIFLGLVLGLLGSVLLFLVAFTDHTYSFNNLNLFMINPIALFVIPSAILYLIKGSKWRSKLDMLWYIQLVSALIMIILKASTPVKQDNLLEIILILPILIAFTPL